MIVNKRYRTAFVVEKSKLTRLMGVIKNSIHHETTSYEESFEVRLRGAKTIAANSLQHVIELDNSERSRLERLIIRCETKGGPNDEPMHSVEVDFDAQRPVDITIKVMSDDSKLASEVTSVAEEQVERMLERGLVYRLLGNREWGLLFLVLAVSMTMVGAVASLFPGANLQISKTMWLTPSDLADIEPMVRGRESITPDQATDVLSRQIRNIITQQNASPFSVLGDWRIIVVLFPIVIVITSLVALAYCYPPAVFLWGDAEEWYRRLLARRAWIWNVVVAALVLGIIANLAVFALGSLISSRTT